ncbi:MAG: hypothetical protein HKL80_03090 [Acidimicrobiales bacterium]|nr:hypothetical protein [Acidimicrobiales bacterium]
MEVSEPPRWATSRLAKWRLKSKVCIFIDIIIFVEGLLVIALVTTDNIVSWFGNKVLIPPKTLEIIFGIAIVPGWIWIFLSVAIVTGFRHSKVPRPKDRKKLPRSYAISLISILVVFLAFTIVGFVFGGAKGSERILPNGLHQVSTLDLNNADWTTVGPKDYQMWEARFVREDEVFWIFGFAMSVAIGELNIARSSLRSMETLN